MGSEHSAKPKILAFAGSSRTGSFNKKLIKVAALGAEKAGAEVTVVDLRDFPMPIYDGDLEDKDGLPPMAKKWKELLIAHDGFLIASPEYNSSISALLKNAIDWASRSESDDEPPLVCFKGKVVSLMSASPGALGGLRGLVTVRSILGNIGVIVLPDQIAVSKAHEAFAEDGSLKDARQQVSVERLGENLTHILQKMQR
jgi:chromate reductase, NAD(P)H dehydrogenase (quinone)